MITADVVATAIVAACRETGEDPIACATPAFSSTFRARHYAMWALLHVFPREKPGHLAALVGAPGPRPVQFFNNSRQQALPGRRPGGGGWWVADSYAKVVAATELAASVPLHRQADCRKDPPSSSTEPGPRPYKPGPLPAVDRPALRTKPKIGVGTLEPGGYRPAPGTYEAELDDDDEGRTVFDRGDVGFTPRRRMREPTKSKREMEEDLRRAVQNTAARTPPPED